MNTNEDLKAKYPNVNIIEFCYKCHKLYKVPDLLLSHTKDLTFFKSFILLTFSERY